jgi:hypothetical protein
MRIDNLLLRIILKFPIDRLRCGGLTVTLLVLTFLAPLLVQGQDELPHAQFGVRFGYGLEFPSKNLYRGEDFALFEAGHRLGFGGFVNIPGSPKVQFSPYLGLEHVFWPKGQGYDVGCELDSFPTFYSVKDTLPGRNFRMYNIVFEPSIKVKSSKMSVWFRFVPMFSLNFRTRVEHYFNTCGLSPQREWLEYARNDLRRMSGFDFGLGISIVKEVSFSSGSFLALEIGVRNVFTQTLFVNHENPDSPDFSLYPWGFFVNLGFMR